MEVEEEAVAIALWMEWSNGDRSTIKPERWKARNTLNSERTFPSRSNSLSAPIHLHDR